METLQNPQMPCFACVFDQRHKLLAAHYLNFGVAGERIIKDTTTTADLSKSLSLIEYLGLCFVDRANPNQRYYSVFASTTGEYRGIDVEDLERQFLTPNENNVLGVVPTEEVPYERLQPVPGAQGLTRDIMYVFNAIKEKEPNHTPTKEQKLTALMNVVLTTAEQYDLKLSFIPTCTSLSQAHGFVFELLDGSRLQVTSDGCIPLPSVIQPHDPSHRDVEQMVPMGNG